MGLEFSCPVMELNLSTDHIILNRISVLLEGSSPAAPVNSTPMESMACLGDELLTALNRVTDQIDGVLDTFSDLSVEIDRYQDKKKLAQTIGTVYGVTGAILAPFTLGISLAVTAVGAAVNITTDLIDASETKKFSNRIQSHLESLNYCLKDLKRVQDKVKASYERALASGIKDESIVISVALWSRDSDHARRLLAVLATPAIKVAVKFYAKNSYAICSMLGIKLTSKAGLESAKLGLKTAFKFGRAAAVVGGVVAVIEIVSLFEDLKSDHAALKTTRQVIGQLRELKSEMKGYYDYVQELKKEMDEIEREMLQKEENLRQEKEQRRRQEEKRSQEKDKGQQGDKPDGKSGRKGDNHAAGGSNQPPERNPNGNENKKTSGSSSTTTQQQTDVVAKFESVTLRNGNEVQRITRVTAVIRPENLRPRPETHRPRWANTNSNCHYIYDELDGDRTRDESGCSRDKRGHLIASSLGGPGIGADGLTARNNIVPMDRKLNNGHYKSFENDVANMIRLLVELNPGKRVEAHVVIDVDYPNDHTARPSYFRYRVSYYVNGREQPALGLLGPNECNFPNK